MHRCSKSFIVYALNIFNVSSNLPVSIEFRILYLTIHNGNWERTMAMMPETKRARMGAKISFEELIPHLDDNQPSRFPFIRRLRGGLKDAHVISSIEHP